MPPSPILGNLDNFSLVHFIPPPHAPPLTPHPLTHMHKIRHERVRAFLTLSWPRPLSYRNQSIDLLCK